ncbi:MAG: hypothetical protein JWP32_1671 [Schumannella sp.]|jgi:hypothetical protein|nr:hypothetical protein [Schumannella sp.]
MFGNAFHWDFFEILAKLASILVGSILFLIWVALLVLLVRFLLIGTRAAKLYLRTNGAPDGVLPPRATTTTVAPAATTPAATTPAATRPVPRPRTPKP